MKSFVTSCVPSTENGNLIFLLNPQNHRSELSRAYQQIFLPSLLSYTYLVENL